MQTSGAEISLRISTPDQTLDLLDSRGQTLVRYPVSTSQFGLGTEPGSLRTPLGRFRVAEKIGAGEPLGAVFKSRAPTGENGLGSDAEDLILTRILWLEGLEEHNANTRERFIYIHGTNHESKVGHPASHGCIRMRNADVADLFERVPIGSLVTIVEA